MFGNWKNFRSSANSQILAQIASEPEFQAVAPHAIVKALSEGNLKAVTPSNSLFSMIQQRYVQLMEQGATRAQAENAVEETLEKALVATVAEVTAEVIQAAEDVAEAATAAVEAADAAVKTARAKERAANERAEQAIAQLRKLRDTRIDDGFRVAITEKGSKQYSFSVLLITPDGKKLSAGVQFENYQVLKGTLDDLFATDSHPIANRGLLLPLESVADEILYQTVQTARGPIQKPLVEAKLTGIKPVRLLQLIADSSPVVTSVHKSAGATLDLSAFGQLEGFRVPEQGSTQIESTVQVLEFGHPAFVAAKTSDGWNHLMGGENPYLSKRTPIEAARLNAYIPDWTPDDKVQHIMLSRLSDGGQQGGALYQECLDALLGRK
jgi:hypothetical protein